MASLTPASPQTAAPTPRITVPETEPGRKAKHSLSHPDKYDGKSKTAYPAFKGHLRAKLRIDRAAIGDEPEQVWYAFGRLADKAANRIFPWIDSTEQRGIPLRVAAFFEQLDAAFYDPQIPQRALEWINNKKQGGTPFRDFLQEFEQKLLEAGGWEFSDGIRKGYLKSALNLEIKTQLVAQVEPETYADYVNLVRLISDNLEEIKRLKRKRNGWTPGHATVGEKDAGEPMEWEPTAQVASGKPPNHRRIRPDNRPRAKWVSKGVLEKRRENQECLRCGGDDHFIQECRYGPPKRPDPECDEPRRNRPVASTTRALEEAPSKPRPTSSKAKSKKVPAPAQVEEVEESEWSSESGSENE
jgi:hypothetical protein